MWFSFFITWEQCKLGNIFVRIVRKNTNNESSLPLTISAQDGLVDQITYFNNRVASRDVSNYYLVLNGEFAYNKSTSDGYPFGAVKRLDLYEKGVLSTLYIVFALKDLSKTDSDYVAVFFDTNRWHRGVAERAAEGARNHGLLNLSAEDFFDIGISLPDSIDEQRKIGRILKRIDNLITLHQCKENLVQNQYSVHSLFQMQYKLAGDWEQRKFGDVFDYERPDRYIVVNDKYDDNFKTPVLTANKGFILGYTNEDRTYDKPCIIFDDFTLDCKLVGFKFMVKSSALKILTAKSGNILRFAYERLNSSKIENLGHARHYISVVQPTETTMPKCDEQERIASLFEQLDNLITLHQCKRAAFFDWKSWPYSKFEESKNTLAWEQRKFGELYRKVSRKNDLTYGESDIISVANMYYKEDSYITDDSYLLTYNVFHLGDIAFEGNKSKDFAHGRFVENTIGNGIVSHVFDVFEPIMSKYDLMFWKYAINNERLMGPILVRATKASTMMTNLVADDFLQEKFLVPSYEEQREIGELLLRIDNLITLHQRVLTTLSPFISVVKNI